MRFPDLDLGNFSDHPPAPKLSFEQYEQWICGEIVPMLARAGKLTDAEILADFMRNEGRQVEEWPNFGAACSP